MGESGVAGSRFAGMTTNERLFTAGPLNAFERAAQGHDRARMTEILAKVELAGQADQIADIILAESKQYES